MQTLRSSKSTYRCSTNGTPNNEPQAEQNGCKQEARMASVVSSTLPPRLNGFLHRNISTCEMKFTFLQPNPFNQQKTVSESDSSTIKRGIQRSPNMKFLFILAVLVSMSTPSFAAGEKPPPEAAIVKVIDQELPSEEDAKQKVLLNVFFDRPDEEKFESYTTENWKQLFAAFATSLTRKAVDQKLDAISLRKVLEFILADAGDQLAYLPVGAYQTTMSGSRVWIITVKWEDPSMSENGKSPTLTHIRVFVFDQKTSKLVGFTTCG